MAIFERKFEQKLGIDDTLKLTCTIETVQKVNSHTEYVIRVQRGYSKDDTWHVLRRYNEFVILHKELQVSGLDLPLPGKKIVGNMRPEFITQRKLALQNYLNVILMNPILASSLPTKKFVDPESYNQSFHDLAAQNASLCLRTEGIFTLGKNLSQIGWRIRKQYFKIIQKIGANNLHVQASGSNCSSRNTKHILTKTNSQSKRLASNPSTDTKFQCVNGSEFMTLSWVEYGPDKYITDKDLNGIFKSLLSIQHPFIMPIEYVCGNESGALFVRHFYNKGSLKDLLYGTLPTNTFLQKYGNPSARVHSGIPIKDIALYGRQILEAVHFLHSRGIPCGHIQAGNVIIVDGCACLVDIENFFLGVPSFYRPFFMQHSKINTCELIDVYCFGHLLYELTFGYPLQESILRQPIECSSSTLKELLDSILSKDACKIGVPNLNELLKHKFWYENISTLNDKPLSGFDSSKHSLQLSTSAKDQIKIAIQKTEHRLREEQRSVKNQKRLVRVQELMSSEEEKRKIKLQKAKAEKKQSKLRQQNSLQLNSTSASKSTIIPRSDSTASISVGSSTTNLTPIASTSLANIPQAPAVRQENDDTRSALFNSICNFDKSALRKLA